LLSSEISSFTVTRPDLAFLNHEDKNTQRDLNGRA
jgi:hypothetical protein